MFKKLRSLFSLENRLTNELQSKLNMGSAHVEQQLSVFSKSVSAGTQQVDKLQADMNRRLSRLEVLFADELAVKEKENVQKIKESRANG